MEYLDAPKTLNKICSALLVGAVALCGLGAPAAAQEGSHRRRSSEAARAAKRAGLPAPLVHEGWRLGSEVAIVFPTSDMGDKRDALAASTGFSPRATVGYEVMFGNLSLTPGIAFQFARFGMEYQDGSAFYIGVQPNVRAALHLGRVAPYASVGVGFDHFFLGGRIGDEVAAAGLNTSASGVGIDLQLGATVILTRSVSASIAWQIHPGFTEFKLVDNQAGGASMAFMSILFGVQYLM